MTALRRSGRAAALVPSLLLLSGLTFGQSDLRDTFERGVQLLDEGDRAGALAEFQRVLASDPSNEAAYELWKTTEHEVWLELLSGDSEFRLIGQRLMDLAKIGREATRDDADAIRSLLDTVFDGDARERRAAVLTLAAKHGEYVAPALLPALEDEVDGDRRVLAIHTLTEIGPRVVLPLVRAMGSDNAYLRRQVAYTLGYIGDSRAAATLAHHAEADEDGGVREAAAEALARMGGSSDAVGGFLALGDAYRAGDPMVLGPGMRSAVAWSWGRSLEKTEVPSYLYADEMAKAAYYDALAADPGNRTALAGIAAASASQAGTLAALRRAGADGADDYAEAVNAGMLAVAAAGPTALDAALASSLDNGDESAAIGLCRALGASASTSTASLSRAVGAGAPIAPEAAMALAHIALRNGSSVDASVVDALAYAAARNVVKLAAIIENDVQRATVIKNDLEARGVQAQVWDTGAFGLASIRRSPGFDVLVVGASLESGPDTAGQLTTQQVIAELQGDYRTENTPLLLSAADADLADELYGDDAAGILTTGDLSALDDALAAEFTGDRAMALDLAAGAANALAQLASAGSADVSSVQGILAPALDRDDRISVHLMNALASGGSSEVADALASVVGSDDRSDDARIAAANALASILGREPGAGASTAEALLGVATSDASFEVRLAASRALGNLDLDSNQRAGLMNDVRRGLGE